MLPRGNQETSTFPTDTASLYPRIPIFYMHPGAHPFCTTPGCICMKHNRELEALLRQVIDGSLKLRWYGSAWASHRAELTHCAFPAQR